MIAFYDVDSDYINFLKKFDSRVPNVIYEGNNKFVCGIVLSINGFNYYAPISHMTQKQRTNMQIKDGNRILSTIRFSFMFPAPDFVLHRKNFANIAATDTKYADLLATEYAFCLSHQDDITKKALAVYKIGCNKEHVLNYTCCDFKLLEAHAKDYK